MKKLFYGVLLLTLSSYAQQDAWIYFTDKENVQESIDNPLSILTQESIDRKALHGISIDERDVPVNEDYINQIKDQEDITVLSKSKWFNCVHVRGGQEDIDPLVELPFVASIVYADQSLNRATNPEFGFVKSDPISQVDFNYGQTENQITMLNVQELHQQDYTGSGMIIAVMDSGFPGVDTQPGFARIRDNGRLLNGYDFVGRSDDEFSFQGSTHGTRVLSDIAGFIQDQFVGTAPDASIYCFRTEDTNQENPVEESWWVEAAERADSLGVDVINTSLGYRSYDNPAYSYSYDDMNGSTAFISQGANIAFEKGMMVVTSAGNSGAGMISAPADAPGSFTIGAVDSEGNYASFSSIGPSSDGRIKPDVMAKGASAAVIDQNNNVTTASGTSFSSPIMAGAVASLWQSRPEKTNVEIMQIIREGSSFYENPTPQMGYGIPDFGEIVDALSIEDNTFAKAFTIAPNPTRDSFEVQFPENNEKAVVEVHDLLGKLVMVRTITNDDSRVNILTLKRGVYLARISSNDMATAVKVIKQ